MKQRRQFELRLGIALIGGLTIPLRGFDLAELDALAAAIGIGNSHLRLFIAGLGKRQLLVERQAVQRLGNGAQRHQNGEAYGSKGKTELAHYVRLPDSSAIVSVSLSTKCVSTLTSAGGASFRLN